jgi:hypothetical protein
MKINGFQNVPAVLQSLRADKSVRSTIEGGGGESSPLALSSFGEVLQSLQRESAKKAGLRGEQVDQLAQLARSGNLPVDLDRLASRLVDLNIIDLQG